MATQLRRAERQRQSIAPFLSFFNGAWLRMSLTASDEMGERGLPRFAAAYRGAVA